MNDSNDPFHDEFFEISDDVISPDELDISRRWRMVDLERLPDLEKLLLYTRAVTLIPLFGAAMSTSWMFDTPHTDVATFSVELLFAYQFLLLSAFAIAMCIANQRHISSIKVQQVADQKLEEI